MFVNASEYVFSTVVYYSIPDIFWHEMLKCVISIQDVSNAVIVI